MLAPGKFSEVVQRGVGALRIFFDAVLRAYAVIFFSQSRVLGGVLLVATFMAPRFGLIGLCGVSVCYVSARLFGFDSSKIQQGIYLFNSLLVSLALAYLNNFKMLGAPALFILLIAASVVTLFATVFLGDILFRYYALPALSLPFVVVAFTLFFLFYSLGHMPIASDLPHYLLPEIGVLSDGVTGFLQALGSIFFLPHSTVGLVVLACLLVWSRLAVLYAVIGYVSGVFFMGALGLNTWSGALGYIGFNFVFCAIALGGIFIIPSRRSVLLVLLGSLFNVILAVGANAFLEPYGVSPLALPLNVVVLLVMYALKCRHRVDGLFCTPFEPERPESNFRRFAVDQARFPDILLPHLSLPFYGERTVTQGFYGSITHRGEWGEGLDFEIIDETGHAFMYEPPMLENSHVFETPVLSPCNGTLVKVINDVCDNLVGQTNTDRNWGNTVIIRDDIGWYVKLSHLKKGSVELLEGARVLRGQVIACCGNSGRSPVPHLHLQVQRTALVGEKTAPFRLTQYIDDGEYHTSGVPCEGARITPVEFSGGTGAHFEFGERCWSCSFNGTDQVIRSELNAAGEYELISGAARLRACIRDRTFCSLDYVGSHDNVLFFVYLGLPRAPFVANTKVRWFDCMDARSLFRSWAGVLIDLVGPFVGYPMVKTETRFLAADAFHTIVETKISNRLPRCFMRTVCPKLITVQLSANGIERVQVG